MGRKSIETHDFCTPGCWNSENGDHVPSLYQSTTECMFSLKADDGDHIGLILDRMFEVVQDASAFTHPGGRDDDAGTFHGVEAFAVVDGGHKVDIACSKQIAICREGFCCLLIVAFRMSAEDFCCLRSQRRINVDR